jgi:SAM-dependent methyltransferase
MVLGPLPVNAANTPRPHEEAARFFDRVSSSYRDKYARKSRFHHYFFTERLEKAVQGLDLSDADVLDIGSGTGNLHDHLLPLFPRMRFHATDVSAGMLAQSRVPQERRFVGHAYAHPFATKRFDAIFMLGVTTYLSAEELKRNLAFIAEALKPGGVAVISVSNAHALDTWNRSVVRWLVRPWKGGGRVIASGLKLHNYSRAEARRVVEQGMSVERMDLLNHTVFPFNHLFPKVSVGLAGLLARVQGTPAWLRWLSSDLLVRARAQATLP